MLKYLKGFLIKAYIKSHEHKFGHRLKYLYQNNHSDTLIVVFSGFADKPVYNYVRTLQNIQVDKMFILDDFGDKGSYYWYEDGNNTPMILTKLLINKMRGGYKRLITIGSSKGGTCAIYYGLSFGASEIYAGACQYYVGKYLNTKEHIQIFKAMTGTEASDKEQKILDNEMPAMIRMHKNSTSRIHLLYSKNEHTYNDDIQYLIQDLDSNNIVHFDKIENFTDHGDVGKYFSPWIKDELTKVIKNG